MACVVRLHPLHPKQNSLERLPSPAPVTCSQEVQSVRRWPCPSSRSVPPLPCTSMTTTEFRRPSPCSLRLPVNGRKAEYWNGGGWTRSARHAAVAVAAAASGLHRGRAVVCVLKNEVKPLMELSQGQSYSFHELASGLRMEMIIQRKAAMREGAQEESGKPPLVFVHGSYHAAWCWACWWLPYFSARGHDCYAVSLIGQGGSDVPVEKVSLSLQSHAEDIAHFIQHNFSEPPVLIGHSFGGLIIQWYLSRLPSTSNTSTGHEDAFPAIQAAALICSSPPTGNGPMVKRFIKRDLVASMQITLSLAAKLFGVSLSLCRKSFFSPDLPEEDLRKYQSLLKQSSRYPMMDMRKLNDDLPVPKLSPKAPPVFVLAAENDFVVDREGSYESAEWYGTVPQFIQGSGHDMMLDTAWETGAEALYSWLEQQAWLQAA